MSSCSSQTRFSNGALNESKLSINPSNTLVPGTAYRIFEFREQRERTIQECGEAVAHHRRAWTPRGSEVDGKRIGAPGERESTSVQFGRLSLSSAGPLPAG